MENTPSCPRRLNVNLKNLPPINNPLIGNGNHSSIPAKFEKSRYIRRVPQFPPEMRRNECYGLPMKPACSDSARGLSMKTIPEASSDYFDKKKENSREMASTCRHSSAQEGTSEKRAAKSLLFEICTANYWRPPLFKCCEDAGPSHAKKYRFKVIVEMKGASGAVLECYGNLQTRKKAAEEQAAEGAVWYLNHLGYRFKR